MVPGGLSACRFTASRQTLAWSTASIANKSIFVFSTISFVQAMQKVGRAVKPLLCFGIWKQADAVAILSSHRSQFVALPQV